MSQRSSTARSLLFALQAVLLAVSSFARADDERESPPHPEPRVIVTVQAVHGPHDKRELERAARLGWGKIVRCYKADGRRVRGSVRVKVDVSKHGKVIGVRRKSSTLRDKALTRCLANAMRGLEMPKARRGSTATIEIQAGPGDL